MVLEFIFSIVNPRQSEITETDEMIILDRLSKAYAAYSENSQSIIQTQLDGSKKLSIKIPREHFISRMRNMARFLENHYQDFIKKQPINVEKRPPKPSNDEDPPYLLLLMEYKGMKPGQVIFINEIYHSLGINIYLENFMNGVLVTFKKKEDFDKFVEVFRNTPK